MASLNNKLKKIEAAQRSNYALMADLSKQGKDKPDADGIADVRKWMARMGEPVVVLAMAHNDPHVKALHSFIHYASAGCHTEQFWDGKWMAVVGDRADNGENPP